MPSVQSLTMTYNAVNEYGTFSEGDTITGKVTLVLSKSTTVESLFVKVKGDANVRWTKRVGDRTYSYSAHRRYFKQKQFLIPTDSRDTAVHSGTHVYNFSLNIPHGGVPSSFNGTHGNILYTLVAKLSRSWKMDTTVTKNIIFVSKSIPNLQSLTSQQAGSTDKQMGFFTSKGTAHMDVIVNKKGYAPGETIAVVAKVKNSSKTQMTPKFALIRDVVFMAQGDLKHEKSVINKIVDDRIESRTEKSVRCAIKIPRDVCQTITNCDIISVEYHVKVYLDISFASDPEIKFPVVIIPPDCVSGCQPGPASAYGAPSQSDFPPTAGVMGPFPASAYGAPSQSDFHPTAGAMGPYPMGAVRGSSYRTFPAAPVAMGLSPYGPSGSQSYSAPPPAYPAQPASWGYNNSVPAQPSPYGDPSLSQSSVLHPPPTGPTFHPPPSAPPPFLPPSHLSPAPSYSLLPSAPEMNTDFLSQTDEAPPSYSLLFPSTSTSDNSEAK